jgi:hypothetical protein
MNEKTGLAYRRGALERSAEVFPEHPGEPIIRHDGCPKARSRW